MNLEAIHYFWPPFAMCLVLIGIHCYLGFHVLARGVIFVDLSLAQVAAFGATLALLWGWEHGSTQSYFVSLVTTFLAAGLFAFARRFEDVFPQEALIGLVFALSAAAVVIVVDQLAHGAEHIKEVMVGHILWVSWQDVFKTALIYSSVGLIHYIFRKPLIACSFGKNPSGFWDFVFYSLFGVVITSSVSFAGILLVFGFLIVPPLIASVFVTDLRQRLILGWILGALLSVIGLVASFWLNLPAGAVVVVVFTVTPLLILFGKLLKVLVR